MIVWSNRHLVGRLGKWTFRLAVFLTFAAAVAALLPISSWFPAVLAFIAGGAEVFVIIAERRKERLVEAFKKTKPQVDAQIASIEPSGKYSIIIKPLNEVPFECDWRTVTKNNVIVSSIGLEWHKIVPSKETPAHQFQEDLHLEKIRGGYIELRLRFRSVYASDYPTLALSDRVVRRYRLAADNRLDPVEDG